MSKESESGMFQWTEWEGVTPLSDRESILYYLDHETREILTTKTEDGRTGVRLSPREMEILTILVESGGVRISAQILGREIWPYMKLKSSAQCARVYIQRLKRRLEKVSPELADNLETSAWQGYEWKWEGNPYSPSLELVTRRNNQW